MFIQAFLYLLYINDRGTDMFCPLYMYISEKSLSTLVSTGTNTGQIYQLILLTHMQSKGFFILLILNSLSTII